VTTFNALLIFPWESHQREDCIIQPKAYCWIKDFLVEITLKSQTNWQVEKNVKEQI
jgi:hypothetical protein